MDEYLAIFESDLPEHAKIARGFDWITRGYVDFWEREVELRRAMQDREALVKEQIKLNLMKHVRGIFHECYKRATGEEAWDEQDGE